MSDPDLAAAFHAVTGRPLDETYAPDHPGDEHAERDAEWATYATPAECDLAADRYHDRKTP